MGEENRGSSGSSTAMIVIAILGGLLLVGICGGVAVVGVGMLMYGAASDVKMEAMQARDQVVVEEAVKMPEPAPLVLPPESVPPSESVTPESPPAPPESEDKKE